MRGTEYKGYRINTRTGVTMMNRKRAQLKKFIKNHSDQPWNAKCRDKTNFNKGTGSHEHLAYKLTIDDFAAIVDYMLVLEKRIDDLHPKPAVVTSNNVMYGNPDYKEEKANK